MPRWRHAGSGTGHNARRRYPDVAPQVLADPALVEAWALDQSKTTKEANARRRRSLSEQLRRVGLGDSKRTVGLHDDERRHKTEEAAELLRSSRGGMP